jgi:hypothetical protein
LGMGLLVVGSRGNPSVAAGGVVGTVSLGEHPVAFLAHRGSRMVRFAGIDASCVENARKTAHSSTRFADTYPSRTVFFRASRPAGT